MAFSVRSAQSDSGEFVRKVSQALAAGAGSMCGEQIKTTVRTSALTSRTERVRMGIIVSESCYIRFVLNVPLSVQG
jgi:hypothetical protein